MFSRSKRRVVTTSDGQAVKHKGRLYKVTWNGEPPRDTEAPLVWIAEALHDRQTGEAGRLLLYTEPYTTSQCFVGHADTDLYGPTWPSPPERRRPSQPYKPRTRD